MITNEERHPLKRRGGPARQRVSAAGGVASPRCCSPGTRRAGRLLPPRSAPSPGGCIATRCRRSCRGNLRSPGPPDAQDRRSRCRGMSRSRRRHSPGVAVARWRRPESQRRSDLRPRDGWRSCHRILAPRERTGDRGVCAAVRHRSPPPKAAD